LGQLVCTWGHWLWNVGHLVGVGGHWVATGHWVTVPGVEHCVGFAAGQLVTTFGHCEGCVGHCVGVGGHCVVTTGHWVADAAVGQLVLTLGH